MKTPATNQHTASLNAIMTYSHPGMIERLQAKLHLTESDACELFADTKRFLYLSATTDGPLAPPELIDECWHHFILHTADYRAFCERYLGRFVEHFPKTRRERAGCDGSAGRRAREAALAAFGESLSSNWRYSNSANCVSCDTPSTNCQDTD